MKSIKACVPSALRKDLVMVGLCRSIVPKSLVPFIGEVIIIVSCIVIVEGFIHVKGVVEVVQRGEVVSLVFG